MCYKVREKREEDQSGDLTFHQKVSYISYPTFLVRHGHHFPSTYARAVARPIISSTGAYLYYEHDAAMMMAN